VTAAHDYEDLHRLVDQLTPDQVQEVRQHALRLVDKKKWPLRTARISTTSAAFDFFVSFPAPCCSRTLC
jgi:hypothetical protein